MQQPDIGLDLSPGDRTEWLVADLSLARALFSGVPAARLLARARLGSDERDLSESPRAGAPPVSSWEGLQKRLLAKSQPTFDKVKRQVARHTRAASDEGPFFATDAVVASLTYAAAASIDGDASLAEIFAHDADPKGAAAVDPAVVRACSAYDGRLASPAVEKSGPLFEACVRLTTRVTAGPWAPSRLLLASRQLLASPLGVALVRPSNVSLFPRDFEPYVARVDRRMVLLERAELDVLVARDPRELAGVIARLDKETVTETRLDSLLADLGRLLAHPGALVLAVAPVTGIGDEVPSSPPSGGAPSWLPTDWSSPDAGAALADAFERGMMTFPRLRAAVARGGDEALDAIGAEMLRAAAHPFASATFAELLAKGGRARDVVRLVTYFAVAPDPELAARAIAVCTAPELPSVLLAWLEAMLPSDGGLVKPGADPLTSTAARLLACVESLEPYPHLYRAVAPLLGRISAAPVPASG